MESRKPDSNPVRLPMADQDELFGSTAQPRIPGLRLLVVLGLALTLVAYPALNPGGASARYMSESGAGRACSNAGGTVSYDTEYEDASFIMFTMTCTLPSQNSFSCSNVFGEPAADMWVNCA